MLAASQLDSWTGKMQYSAADNGIDIMAHQPQRPHPAARSRSKWSSKLVFLRRKHPEKTSRARPPCEAMNLNHRALNTEKEDEVPGWHLIGQSTGESETP